MRDLDNENLQVMKDLLTWSATGRWERVGSLYTRDVKLHFPGRNRFSGDYVGMEQALRLLIGIWEWTNGTASSDVHDILANDQHGVLMYTVRASHGERSISYRYLDIYHFCDGAISEVWGQPVGDTDAFDAFYRE